MSGAYGDGAGKVGSSLSNTRQFQGGGTGGSIRDAGGIFGKMEAAREGEYFLKKVFPPKIPLKYSPFRRRK